jgi:membrane protein DedA with SNARE-associated domain
LVWAAGALAVLTLSGAAFMPYLAVHHPYWLLALNPWPRHQILVAPHAELGKFVALVGARGFFNCWISYELGRHYGVKGQSMLAGHAPSLGQALQHIEHVFARFSGLVLLFVPGLLTSALAGISGFSRPVAMLLSTAGLSGWAFVNYQLGDWLEPYTERVLQFMRDNMIVATLICALIAVIYKLNSRRSARTGSSSQKAKSDSADSNTP